MYRLLVTAFLVAFLASSAAAFSHAPNSNAVGVSRPGIAQTTTAFPTASLTSTTSLRLRVEADPDQEGDRINPAVFKNGLYLGSIAFAVLLPVFLLVVGSK